MLNWIKKLFETTKEEPVIFAPTQWALGAELEEVDYRDITTDQLVQASKLPPAKYFTELYSVPVTDQKNLGSCVGQAEGSYIEYLNREDLKGKNISRRFIYALCKRFDGVEGEGTHPRVASSILRNIGATTVDHIEDNNTLPHEEFINIPKTGEAYITAQDFKVKGFALIRNVDVDSLKKAIIQYGLVTVTLPVDWSAGWLSKEGFLNKAVQKIFGYHRVVLFGYETNKTDTIFYFRNSFGRTWGTNGDGKLSYQQYIGKIHDARVYTDIPKGLIDEAKKQNFIFTKTLRFGDKGTDVKELQKVLGVNPDGIFGEFTRDQVVLYQTLNNLKADGIVGAQTRQLLNNASVGEEAKRPSVSDLAEAIKIHEGWFKGSRSQRNNNPGNIRFASQANTIGKDDKGFAIFKTYADGFAALCRLITNAKSGKSRVYKPEMSLLEFFSVYAPSFDNNDPNNYARFVAQKLKVSIDFKIGDLV